MPFQAPSYTAKSGRQKISDADKIKAACKKA